MSIAPPPTPRTVTIPADDGAPLSATVFAPAAADLPTPVTVIAGATGVPARFYNRFATYLAEHGRTALTFDYRGIGASLQGPAWQSSARYRDWGVLDCPGVLDWVDRTFPGRPIHWVGQSYGGFAAGLAHNNRLIARHYAVSTMSADYRLVEDPLERWKIAGLLFSFAPMLAHTIGHVPGWVNGGADLPKGVALEWARWCGTPGFIFGLPDLPETRHFATLRAPMRFDRLHDDPWVGQRAVEELARRFTSAASRELVVIGPDDARGRPVGHIGLFRAEHRDSLWPRVLAWLDG